MSPLISIAKKRLQVQKTKDFYEFALPVINFTCFRLVSRIHFNEQWTKPRRTVGFIMQALGDHLLKMGVGDVTL